MRADYGGERDGSVAEAILESKPAKLVDGAAAGRKAIQLALGSQGPGVLEAAVALRRRGGLELRSSTR